MMYALKTPSQAQPLSGWATLRQLLALLPQERKNLRRGGVAIVLNSTANLLGPFVIGYAIDRYVQHGRYAGVVTASCLLCMLYATAFLASHFQNKIMGSIGLRLLFTLRNTLFDKLQRLPVAFFNANQAGDLIFRVNSDLDKLNNFVSQSLMSFIGSSVMLLGSGVFLLALQVRLGLAALAPALFILLFTRLTASWVKRRNAHSLQVAGELSARVHENLNNFRLFAAFNRRDYLRQRFAEANQQQYHAAVRAAVADNLFLPVYGLFGHLAQLITLVYGLALVATGHFAVGLLVSSLLFTTLFYSAARMLAGLWSNFQHAAVGWSRIAEILSLPPSLPVLASSLTTPPAAFVEVRDVRFGYGSGVVLDHISLQMEQGKTYAFVGPTGGGKTTLASLLARLYDPEQGTVWLAGRDLRSYTPAERARKIGFIQQDPFLFTGTVRDNILYGNEDYQHCDDEQLQEVLRSANLQALIRFFENGLHTLVLSPTGSISLGQKQLIAFMRAVLRNPELLILDEATANLDPEMERLLDDILQQLPASTTRVIIAHRLNTIAEADAIYFINAGNVTQAGSLTEAINKLYHESRVS
jgi:ATP-binding cassette subfamily B protein